MDAGLRILIGQTLIVASIARRAEAQPRQQLNAWLAQELGKARDNYPELHAELESPKAAQRFFRQEFDSAALDVTSIMEFFIELIALRALYFTDLRKPTELKPELVNEALKELAVDLGIDNEFVSDLIEIKADAEAVFRTQPNWLLLGAAVVGGAAVMAAGGVFAAPLIGGIIGSAMGLSGAAAVSAGLALLGGGSLAAGGAGMAGGAWLVAGVGAAIGATSLGAAAGQAGQSRAPRTALTEEQVTQILLELTPAALRLEMVKLMMRYVLVNLSTPEGRVQARLEVRRLSDFISDLEERIARLREDQVPDHQQKDEFKALHDKIQVLKLANGWMTSNAS